MENEKTPQPVRSDTAQPAPAAMVSSTADARTVNNVVRHEYRVLTDEEKAQVLAVKDKGRELIELLASIGTSREISLAITNAQQAVMWGVNHITA